MNRVNLLRPLTNRGWRIAPSADRRSGALACTVLLAILASGLGLWGRRIQHEENHVARELSLARRAMAGLRTAVAQAEETRLTASHLQRSVAEFEALRVAQHAPVRILDAISAALPEDCWLTGITDEPAGAVRIEGRGSALDSVFAFAERLQISGVFGGGVEVLESRASREGEEDVVAFALRGSSGTHGVPAAAAASEQTVQAATAPAAAF